MSVSRIYRLLRLVTMLQGGRNYTADELCTELEVSRRTVFRDLNMLEMAHIPYYFDAQRGGYKIGQHFFLPPINLTLPEALSMLLLTRLHGGKGLPLLSHGSRAAVKVESVLPGALREHVGSVLNHVSFCLSPLSRHEGTEGLFDQLAQAIIHRRTCQLVYLSLHERKQLAMEVHPLRLIFQGRAWYLLAYSVAHHQVRTFKLIRIRKLTVSRRTFPLHAEVDPERYFGDAWSMIPGGRIYDVHVRFGKRVASNVAEVQWHKSQRIEWNDDGTLDFFARVDGLGEITWWVLGYGQEALVIAPPELRRRVAEAAGAVAARYEEKAT